MLRHTRVTCSGTGEAVTVTPVYGLLEYIQVAYTNGQATGDLTIVDAQSGLSLVTLTNHNTNFNGPLRKQAVDQTGAAIAGAYERLAAAGSLVVTSAQQAGNTVVTVDLWWSA